MSWRARGALVLLVVITSAAEMVLPYVIAKVSELLNYGTGNQIVDKTRRAVALTPEMKMMCEIMATQEKAPGQHNTDC